MKLDTWLRKNTFHHSQYWDIMQLVREKEKQNLMKQLVQQKQQQTFNEWLAKVRTGSRIVIEEEVLQ